MANRIGLGVRGLLRWKSGFWTRLGAGLREDWPWYLVSFLVHAAAVLIIGILGALAPMRLFQDPRQGLRMTMAFDAVDAPESEPSKFIRFDVGEAPLDPTELNTATLKLYEYKRAAQTAQHNDNSAIFRAAGGGMETVVQGPELGGLGGFRVENRPGPGGPGGVGTGHGHGTRPGSGGAGDGFGVRGSGHREALVGGFGGTKASERAVAAALNWFYRHQNPNGSWSLQHTRRCAGASCSAPGSVRSDSAATALALLPFLAAGQTHESNGPYKQAISSGLFWLVKRQRPDGDLSTEPDNRKPEFRMYSHALATIALCEAYGMTKDKRLLNPAQAAVRFIEYAQNESTGAWRYEPGDPGDTSVTGWQIMALRSAQMAYLAVSSRTIYNTRKWLALVSKGEHGGLYSYQPYREVTPTMTAVGMLSNQYLGMGRDDPAMLESRDHLLENMPDNNVLRSTYYWYYATLSMHNYLGPQWDEWNRRTRRALIETQARDGCAMGSWDPERPTLDVWGQKGGRLMMTSLATLTLEIYYRYLPLFGAEASQPPPPPPEPLAHQ